MISRRLFRTVLALVVAGVMMSSWGVRAHTTSAAPAHAKTLVIGNIGWDEDVAINSVLQIAFQQRGYNVTLRLADAGLLYGGLAQGSIDVFMDGWLPLTHKAYWARYHTKLIKLNTWYKGPANLGLAVPDYSPAKSIADLNKYASLFGGQITGIEPGAGEMAIVQSKVIPGYNLHLRLLEASTPAMLATLQRDVKAKKEIVVTLWKPHWAFTAYPIRYLTDPKHLMGGTEQVWAIVRKGLATSDPTAYKVLSRVSMTQQQLGTLELAIKAQGPAAGAQSWLKTNKSVVDAWFK
ncbi:MAG: glycine betaine ABC transporter substrate-binding protein [Chloroflexi bacterium]|nr:glycine betaine ABC transporter substrate-binding protein [Chloroflexota bacterium]